MLKNYLKSITPWLTLLAVIAVMTLIFCFSAQTQTESVRTSGHLVDMVIELFIPGFDGLPAQIQAEKTDIIAMIIRKLAHFTEYAVLGFLLSLHFNELRRKLSADVRFTWAAVIGIIYAASDEIHQLFVPGRGPGMIDVFIDSIGVMAGIAVFIIITGKLVNFLKHR